MFRFIVGGLAVLVLLVSGCTSKKTVLINSEPDAARVILDSVDSGKTPFSKELEFPEEKPIHKVVLKKEGYFDEEFEIAYQPEEMTEYSRKLEKLNKEISIESNPDGAKVYLGGKEVGHTPYSDTLYFDKKEEYKFKLAKPRYEEQELSINFDPESKTEYFVQLSEAKEVMLELPDFVFEKIDGKTVRTLRFRKSLALKEVIERSPNVKTVSKITNYNDSTINIGKFTISPDGKTVVYPVIVREEDGKMYSNLWKKPVDSSNKTRVTFGKYMDESPTFDPDGRYIYFSSNRNSRLPSLWRVGSSGGGGITKITSSQSQDSQPTVNEETVVFSSIPMNAEDPQIWAVRTDGNLLTQLREGANPNLPTAEEKILFTRKDSRTGNEQIWSMSLDGSNETLLSNDPQVNDTDPVMSPDGRFVAYTSDAGKDSKGRSNEDIWVMRSDGSRRTQLTTNGSEDDYPRWSPSGRYVYFRSNRGIQPDIWRLETTLPTAVAEKPARKVRQTETVRNNDAVMQRIYDRLNLN